MSQLVELLALLAVPTSVLLTCRWLNRHDATQPDAQSARLPGAHR